MLTEGQLLLGKFVLLIDLQFSLQTWQLLLLERLRWKFEQRPHLHLPFTSLFSAAPNTIKFVFRRSCWCSSSISFILSSCSILRNLGKMWFLLLSLTIPAKFVFFSPWFTVDSYSSIHFRLRFSSSFRVVFRIISDVEDYSNIHNSS